MEHTWDTKIQLDEESKKKIACRTGGGKPLLRKVEEKVKEVSPLHRIL
jgi:hypothetical protein